MNNIFETLNDNYIKYNNYIINVIIDVNHEIWFHAKHSAIALGYADPRGAIRKHVDKKSITQIRNIKHKSKIKSHPQTLYLSEGGLYRLILSSRLPKAKKFSEWITHDVLPSIRKYGFYKLKKQYEEKQTELLEKLNYMVKENENMKKELKKEKFPDGGLVYAIDYSDDNNEIYRIGMTSNMNMRKKIYNSHSLYKRNVPIMKEAKCPIKLEYCIRGMLYEYRYRNKKDFYICKLKEIKKAFKICSNSIDCMTQDGGNISFDNEINKIKYKINKINVCINKLNNKINM